MFKPEHILVPTDFSVESDQALAAAIDIAGKYHADVDLLYVLDEVDQCSVDYCMRDEDYMSMKQGLLKEARRKMGREIRAIAGKRHAVVSRNFRWGNHLDEILGEVEEKDIDLLVVGPHVEHKPWNLILGHLTDRVIKDSPCETLLVK